MRSSIAVLASLLIFSSSVHAAELDEHLRIFQPLLESVWAGGYVGEDAPDLEIVLRFEAILDGMAIRYSRDAEAVDFAAVTHFYWNPDRKEVCFLSLNSRGMVDEGVVESDGDTIVLRGKSIWPDRIVEFKTELHLDEDGTLRDTFTRKENTGWEQGHVQEFVVRN